MFRAVVLLATLLSVAAFAPIARISRGSAIKMSYDPDVGALPPTGFWDPLGLSKDASAETLKSYREAELKHGRVAMLAVVGYLVQERFRLPGAIDLDGTTFDSIPNGVAAIGAIPSMGWLQITASIGYWELVGWQEASDGPGDFGFGANALPKGEKQQKEIYTKEIQNGRLAMLGIMELLTHDIAKPAGESLFAIHHF